MLNKNKIVKIFGTLALALLLIGCKKESFLQLEANSKEAVEVGMTSDKLERSSDKVIGISDKSMILTADTATADAGFHLSRFSDGRAGLCSWQQWDVCILGHVFTQWLVIPLRSCCIISCACQAPLRLPL